MYALFSCVESEQTYPVSRSLIPVPLLICVECYVVEHRIWKVVVYAKPKNRRNHHIVIQCGKHLYLHQGVHDSERPT